MGARVANSSLSRRHGLVRHDDRRPAHRAGERAKGGEGGWRIQRPRVPREIPADFARVVLTAAAAWAVGAGLFYDGEDLDPAEVSIEDVLSDVEGAVVAAEAEAT